MNGVDEVAGGILRDATRSAKGRLFAAMAERALEGAIPGHSSRGGRRGWVGSSIGELALEAGTDKHSAVHLLHGLKADGFVTFAEHDEEPVRLRLTRSGLERAVQEARQKAQGVTIEQVPAERLDGPLAAVLEAPGRSSEVKRPCPYCGGETNVGAAAHAPDCPALRGSRTALRTESNQRLDEALQAGDSYTRTEDTLGRATSIGEPIRRRRAFAALGEYAALADLYRQAAAMLAAEAALTKVGRSDLAGLIGDEASRLTPAEKDAVALVRDLLERGVLKEEN